MKKTFLSLLLLSFFLTGCATQSLEQTTTLDQDNYINITGSYSYYLETDDSITPYKKTAINKVCFEPAEMETINEGQLFCFTNTQKALEILKIQHKDNDCKKYWGAAEIKIQNLSTKNINNSKGDICVKNGNCKFNEAELIEIVKLYDDSPKCNK